MANKILKKTIRSLGDKVSTEPLSYWDTAQRILKIHAGKPVSPRFLDKDSTGATQTVSMNGFEKKQRELKLIYSVKNKPEFIRK